MFPCRWFWPLGCWRTGNLRTLWVPFHWRPENSRICEKHTLLGEKGESFILWNDLLQRFYHSFSQDWTSPWHWGLIKEEEVACSNTVARWIWQFIWAYDLKGRGFPFPVKGFSPWSVGASWALNIRPLFPKSVWQPPGLLLVYSQSFNMWMFRPLQVQTLVGKSCALWGHSQLFLSFCSEECFCWAYFLFFVACPSWDWFGHPSILRINFCVSCTNKKTVFWQEVRGNYSSVAIFAQTVLWATGSPMFTLSFFFLGLLEFIYCVSSTQ